MRNRQTEGQINELIGFNQGSINTNLISDGFHTFGELYYHRAVLFAALCKGNKDRSWKSRKHSDGKYPFNDSSWFIVGITTPEGDYTYHYHVDYWNLFKDVEDLSVGKEWDGHKPEDITRLLSL